MTGPPAPPSVRARRALQAAVLTMALAAANAPAGAQDLVVDLSDPVVAVTTGFAGARLVLFGATEGRGDLIVIVRGPSQNAVVRRKEKVAGVWVNRAQFVFADGSCHFLSQTIDYMTYQRLGDRRDGQPVGNF